MADPMRSPSIWCLKYVDLDVGDFHNLFFFKNLIKLCDVICGINIAVHLTGPLIFLDAQTWLILILSNHC